MKFLQRLWVMWTKYFCGQRQSAMVFCHQNMVYGKIEFHIRRRQRSRYCGSLYSSTLNALSLELKKKRYNIVMQLIES